MNFIEWTLKTTSNIRFNVFKFLTSFTRFMPWRPWSSSIRKLRVHLPILMRKGTPLYPIKSTYFKFWVVTCTNHLRMDRLFYRKTAETLTVKLQEQQVYLCLFYVNLFVPILFISQGSWSSYGYHYTINPTFVIFPGMAWFIEE